MTAARTFFALATLALAGGARARAAPPEVHAIVVGHNGGRPGLPPLRYADDDAVRFALLFQTLAGPERVRLLTSVDQDTRQALARAEIAAPSAGRPTRSAVLGAIADLGRTLAARGRGGARVLYFVYAGHGLRGRILLEPEGGPEAALTGVELRTALAELARVDPGLRIFLFLDACRSQSLFADRDGDAGPDLSAEVRALERRAGALQIGVLTAATTGKPAGEVRDLRGGYFSHALASGLAGAADSDGDEVVSFGELAAFVAFNTQRLTGQLPWFDPPGGDLSIGAVDHRGRRPRLVIPAGAAGRFVVEAREGPPIFAEAYHEGRRPVRLALPPGRYRVRRQDGAGRAQVAAADIRPGDLVDASALAWADAPVGARDGDAEEAGLAFLAPFTPEVVSTLAAGYHAGRAPARTLQALPYLLSAGPTAGPAPLDLHGTEVGLQLRLRRALGPALFVAGRASFASSSHAHPRGDFRLQRHALLVEAGLRMPLGRALELSAGAGAGAAGAVRRSSEAPSGDPLGPLAGGGVGARLAIGGPWAVLLEARYLVQWIALDGRRAASGAPALDLAFGLGF